MLKSVSLVHLSVASGTAVWFSLVPGDNAGVGAPLEPVGPGDLVAADSAVDVLVWSHCQQGDVDGTLAVAARETLLVVDLALDVDLLSL